MRAYYDLGTVLGAEDTAVKKEEKKKIPLMEITVGEINIKQC